MWRVFKDYLAVHNVTPVDFFILLALWLIIVILLARLWTNLLRDYDKDDAPGIFAASFFTLVLAPYILMGAWHFINMLTTIFFGFDMYF